MRREGIMQIHRLKGCNKWPVFSLFVLLILLPALILGQVVLADWQVETINVLGWHITTVDSDGIVGGYTSLELDASGYPHISYYDETNGDLRYAWKDGAGWHITTVDSAGIVGRYTSLELDASGYPHISYEDRTNGDLKYAWKDGAGWHITTVDSAGIVGRYTSLELDSSSYPHISYYEGRLKYTWKDGAGWHSHIIDWPSGGGIAGLFTSLELDASGFPHISYYISPSSDLRYAYAWKDGAGWHIHIRGVDLDGVVGGYTSLKLDSSGYPHISYHNYTNGDLKYAWKDGAGWHITTVDSAGIVGRYTSLELDSSGFPHISYYDEANGDLRYAWKDGAGWHITTVDSAGDVGLDTSLELDTSGYPHISYYDAANGDLKYAWLAEPEDATPPTPDPMTWSTAPHATGPSAIEMTATTATDPSGVEYYFGETSGSPGGTDSGWQDSPSYTDTGLQEGTQYSYRVKARDKSPNQNETGWSSTESATPSMATAAVFRVTKEGNVYADGSFYGQSFETGSADVAEWVPVSEPVEPGDVLELDPANPHHYHKARGACSLLVAGVVSTEPGVILGSSSPTLDIGPWTLDSALLALLGIVPVKVTDEGGPIQPGDLLVSSSTPGHAMRWNPDNCSPCDLVGKALEPLTDERGVILVLLMSH